MDDSNDFIMKLFKKLNLFFMFIFKIISFFNWIFDMPPILLPFVYLYMVLIFHFFLAFMWGVDEHDMILEVDSYN